MNPSEGVRKRKNEAYNQREGVKQETGENCVMNTFIFCER